jgi:Putative GTPase activating protein for Arf
MERSITASTSNSHGHGKRVTFASDTILRATVTASAASSATESTATSSPNAPQTTAVTATSTSDLTEMDPVDWKMISKLAGNNNCIDCNAKYPEWGSVSFGILFCTRCCSGHRALGTHISRVRSVRMDEWTFKQIQLMKAGGNQSCQDWFARNGLSKSLSHKLKYDNETARLYTEVLKARVAGRREPVSLMEAKRLKRWNKPKEWWRKWINGEMVEKYNAASSMMKERNSVYAQWQAVTSSSDFWLALYVIALVGWVAILAAWSYR